MRQNTNSRRSRGRGGRKSGGGNRNQVFDSNGPGVRVRGNATQIYEKYQQLARDASSSGDRVSSENLQQHAEHYYRLMLAAGLVRTAEREDQQSDDAEGDRATENRETAGEEAPSSPSGNQKPEKPKPAARSGNGNAAGGEDDHGLIATLGRGGDGANGNSRKSDDSGEGEGEEQPRRRRARRRPNGNGADAEQASEAASDEDSGDSESATA